MAIVGSCYLKVPAALISSTLTDFVHKVDLSTLLADFWTNVDAAGAYIRVKDAAGTDVPFDLVHWDYANQKGTLFFKATLNAGIINEYRIVADNAASAPAATDSIGRNAVWSDYDCFFAGNQPSVNRNGAATTQANLTSGTTSTWGWLRQSAPTNVHQGVAYDGEYFYLIDTNAIFKYNADWELIASNTAPLTAIKAASGRSNLNHVGDGTIKGGELFLAVEQYTNSPYNSQVIAVYNIADLSFNRVYDISAQLHEISSIVWEPVNGYFLITDYTSAGNTVLHKYDSTFAYLGTLSMPSLTQKQGIEYYDNKLYLTNTNGSLYSLTLDGATLTKLTNNAPNGSMEGIASLGDGTFVVNFDASPSALWRAVPNTLLATMYPTALNTLASPPFRCSGLPKRTVWTYGCSLIPMSANGNNSFLSYSDNSTTSGNRATMAVRSGNQWGCWNSSDSWLYENERYTEPSYVGQRYRVHQAFNGTTDRKMWRQGDLESTDTGTSQRPAGTGDTLFVGVEDSSPDERFYGLIDYVYLRNGELSADWMKAEFRSWEAQTMFSVSTTAQADADFAELNQTIGTDTDPGVGATGWTKYGPIADYATYSRATTISAAAYGSRFFMAGAGNVVRARQGPISVAAYGDRIDNGDVAVTLTASVVSDYDSAYVDDKGRFILEFYDGGGALLKRSRTRWRSTAAGVWTDNSLVMACPAGTRSIKRIMEGWLFDGSDMNIGFDIDSLVLYAPEIGTPPVDTGRRQFAAMMIG
jgi:hypothetical protein